MYALRLEKALRYITLIFFALEVFFTILDFIMTIAEAEKVSHKTAEEAL